MEQRKPLFLLLYLADLRVSVFPEQGIKLPLINELKN